MGGEEAALQQPVLLVVLISVVAPEAAAVLKEVVGAVQMLMEKTQTAPCHSEEMAVMPVEQIELRKTVETALATYIMVRTRIPSPAVETTGAVK